MALDGFYRFDAKNRTRERKTVFFSSLLLYVASDETNGRVSELISCFWRVLYGKFLSSSNKAFLTALFSAQGHLLVFVILFPFRTALARVDYILCKREAALFTISVRA